MKAEPDIIRPDWSAPDKVGAISTTRTGGVSEGSWSSLNLGAHCGDKPGSVRVNRERLNKLLPGEPLWLQQVHGIHVFDADHSKAVLTEADAVVCSKPGKVLGILTADCLPVLLCDVEGRRIGAAHAGWRGMADGVIEAVVNEMQTPPRRLMAWLGPSIGPDAYEVGQEVYDYFHRRPGASLADAFSPAERDGGTHKWHLDLAEAARIILADLGIHQVSGGGMCTYSDPARFYSYRRDGVTGRQASLIWLKQTEES